MHADIEELDPALAPVFDANRQEFVACVIRRAHEAPDHLAVVDGDTRISRASLVRQARTLGSALLRVGLEPGAAIAFQLPNWHEACVINLAALLYGFRLVPLLPMYREAEVGQILRECEVQALFLPRTFRGVDYAALLERVRPAPAALRQVFIVRGPERGNEHGHKPGHEGKLGCYERLLEGGSEPIAIRPVAPSEVRMVLYTSGSTGRPKGVLHTHASLAALSNFAREFWALDAADVALVPSPVGHIGGSLYAFDLPWMAGTSAVLMDVWNADQAVRLIEREKVSFFAGATPFLEGLLHAAQATDSALPSLRRFICGGASVPPSLIRRASQAFPACTVSRAYGSTEVPVVSAGIRSRAQASHGASTDGECGAEVRFLDDQGREVAAGEPGEIVARAARMFVGYLNPVDTAGAFTPDGFFRTGDIGRLVDGRYIEITGRKKDIIIRLGENISPLEIENALAQHPAVERVAVIGIPDARTGEAAMAFVVLREGASFGLPAMRAFLLEQGLAAQKCPEHLRIVASLPMNSIGKVLKQELRRLATVHKETP